MNNLLKIHIGIKRKGDIILEHSLSITAAALITVMALVSGIFAVNGYLNEKTEPSDAEVTSVSEESKPEKLLLGIYEGKLALFIGESPYPNEIYDFLTRTLPPEDQKRLSEGIEIFSKEELRLLLEDFMS